MMEKKEISKDYFPIDQSVFDKVLKRRKEHKMLNRTIFHPIDENVFDVVLKRNRQKMSENQKSCQKIMKNSNNNQKHQKKNISDFFPIDQSVFDKVLNRKRPNVTNSSKIVFAKIDENVFDIVLARKRKMDDKPNQNFEPDEVSVDKDHTKMMNESENLLEGSFFQENKIIMNTNVEQQKAVQNDSGQVEPKNNDDDEDDIESLIGTSFIEEPKKKTKKLLAKEYHNDPNFEAMLNSVGKEDFIDNMDQPGTSSLNVSSVSPLDLFFDPQSEPIESQEKSSVSSDLKFESQRTSKAVPLDHQSISSDGGPNFHETINSDHTGLNNFPPTKTQNLSGSNPLDLEFVSPSQPNEIPEKSSFSNDLNFESQHTSSKTTTSPNAKEICSNVLENLVSSTPIYDQQNISTNDNGDQKFHETEAIENENLVESQNADFKYNDITITGDDDNEASSHCVLSEKPTYDLNKTYVVIKHADLTENIPYITDSIIQKKTNISVQKRGGKRKSNTENKSKGSVKDSAGPGYSQDEENDPKEASGKKLKSNITDSIIQKKTNSKTPPPPPFPLKRKISGFQVWKKQQKSAGQKTQNWNLLNDEEKRPFFEEAKIINASYAR